MGAALLSDPDKIEKVSPAGVKIEVLKLTCELELSEHAPTLISPNKIFFF